MCVCGYECHVTLPQKPNFYCNLAIKRVNCDRIFLLKNCVTFW